MQISDINISTTNMPVWWPDNPILGLLFAILGLVGAAIMIYIGEWDRLMGKSARINEIEIEIAEKRKLASKITEPKNVNIREKYEKMINEDEDRLDREKRYINKQGIILYLLVGGILAAVFANGIVAAVTIGASWTAIIGMFGIKKDVELRDKKIAEGIENTEDKIENFTKNIEEVYYHGFSDAVEKIAKARNKTPEDILNIL